MVDSYLEYGRLTIKALCGLCMWELRRAGADLRRVPPS